MSMVVIESVTRETALVFKTMRLRALRDSPTAFSSTYAKEAQASDAGWIERLAQWTDQWTHRSSTVFLAMDGDVPCGIAGSFLHPENREIAQLVSMWTAPTHRRGGVGRMLVNAVIAWAGSRHAGTLLLHVTSNNHPAIAFYERLGFARTERTAPYANDPALLQYEMSRPIV